MTTNIVTEKRLRNELKDLKKNKLDFAQAIQDDTNKFIFYFLLKGDPDSDYDKGMYLGKIMLPENYPAKPGDFMMLTPNGRFTINTKICLSNSGYHSESWTPIWSIRNMIIGFSSIFNSDIEHGISHIKDTSANRKKFAIDSVLYNLAHYNEIFKKFDQFINLDGSILTNTDILLDVEVPKKKKKDLKNVEIVEEEVIKVKEEEVKEEEVKEEEEVNVKENVEIVKNNMVTKKNTTHDLVRVDLEKIKTMSLEQFNVLPFKNIYNLLTISLSEM
jgi:ubiquitin-protein ligase